MYKDMHRADILRSAGVSM